MGVFERRMRIIEYLDWKRKATYDNLANEFEVSKSTIREDIQALMDAHLPLERVRGRYGGVRVSGHFHFYGRPLNARQTELLNRLSLQLVGEDAEIMQSILWTFAMQ